MQRKIRVLIIKWNKWTTKTTPKGKNKQAGRQKTGAQSTWNSHETHERQRISTGLQTQGDYIGRQTRVTRETQLEPLKQWLSNKMGGDRQSTWEHMAPNKQQAMCSTHRDIWWPARAHQQDRDNNCIFGNNSLLRNWQHFILRFPCYTLHVLTIIINIRYA